MFNLTKFYKKTIITSILFVFSGCSLLITSQDVISMDKFEQITQGKFENVNDVVRLFPKSVADIEKRVELAISKVEHGIEQVLSIKAEVRTFENTVRAMEKIEVGFSMATNGIQVLEMVSPDEKIRDACHKASIKVSEFLVDAFSTKALYNAFKDYIEGNAKKEKLNDEEKYFLQESMRSYVRQGFNLPDEQFEQVKVIKKEISKLGLEFEKNINTDNSFIVVDRDGLAGLEDDFIRSLKKTDEGKYKVGCDYPTYNQIMENCTVGSTRKKLYFAFMNRAYPENQQILDSIIAKRNQLAIKLNFKSFAELDLDSQMVKSPKRAYEFLIHLLEKTMKKDAQEHNELIKELPKDVQLDEKGRFYHWDFGYVKSQYKKKHFDIDEREVAKYFPVDHTIDKLFDIYQQFLGLEFKQVKAGGLWHEDVRVVQIYDKESGESRGTLFLDLYPRDNKYSHACMVDVVSTVKYKDKQTGEQYVRPAAIMVIANFPKATAEKPALLRHSDVTTFFHEFGHAMHGFLGRTELDSFAGTNVKRDFVELPSQMFEEWMWDKDMLKQVTKHYQTGKTLSDEIIDKKIALKKMGSGFWVTRQCWLALIALEYFAPGENKDLQKIKKDLHEKYVKNIRFEPQTYFQSNFGHLVGYGAKYYGYMWSKVFALDLFYKVKKEGLMSYKAGSKIRNNVLGKGGSVEPDEILKNYLGREPNQDSFLKDLGI